MDNYDIRYGDKYGQRTHIDLAAKGAAGWGRGRSQSHPLPRRALRPPKNLLTCPQDLSPGPPSIGGGMPARRARGDCPRVLL